MKYPPKIPAMTVTRLSLYLRTLNRLANDGETTISSDKLADLTGLTAAQIRKDLAYFGQFGIPGRGYSVANLIHELSSILGLNRRWKVALAGVGHLGSALLGYNGFRKQGFDFVVAFDKDPALIGKSIEGVPVHDIKDAPAVVATTGAEIGVIAVPAASAQEVCEILINAGLKHILTFAPEKPIVPPAVTVKRVDLTMELEWLTFHATRATKSHNRTPRKKRR